MHQRSAGQSVLLPPALAVTRPRLDGASDPSYPPGPPPAPPAPPGRPPPPGPSCHRRDYAGDCRQEACPAPLPSQARRPPPAPPPAGPPPPPAAAPAAKVPAPLPLPVPVPLRREVGCGSLPAQSRPPWRSIHDPPGRDSPGGRLRLQSAPRGGPGSAAAGQSPPPGLAAPPPAAPGLLMALESAVLR
jgi:hypothetical protein